MTPKQLRHAQGVLYRNTSLHEGDVDFLAERVWNPRLRDRANLRRCRAFIHNQIRHLI